MKLENLVLPAFCSLWAVGIAAGANEDAAKQGMEAAQTYLIAIPTAVTIGYLCTKFSNLFDKYFGSFSPGCIAKP